MRPTFIQIAAIAVAAVSCTGRSGGPGTTPSVDSERRGPIDPLLACSYSLAIQIENRTERSDALKQLATELLVHGDVDGARRVFEHVSSVEARTDLMTQVASDLLVRGQLAPALTLLRDAKTPDDVLALQLLETAYDDSTSVEQAAEMLSIATGMLSDGKGSETLSEHAGYRGAILAKTGRCAEGQEVVQDENEHVRRVLFLADIARECAARIPQDEVIQLLREARILMEREIGNDTYSASVATMVLVSGFMKAGMRREALALLNARIEFVRAMSAGPARDMSYMELACGAVEAGLLEQARELGKETGDPVVDSSALRCLLDSHLENGQYEEARAIAGELGDPAYEALVLAGIARERSVAGEFGQASAVLREAVATIEAASTWNKEPKSHDEIARLLVAIGQPEDAFAVTDTLAFYPKDRVRWLIAVSEAKKGDAYRSLEAIRSITEKRFQALAILEVSMNLPEQPRSLAEPELSLMESLCPDR